MVATTTYTYQNVQAVLDGLGISGTFDGDDVIEVAPGADVGSMLIGAGGDGIFSGSADRSAMITIRLQHTSPTHRQLTQKWIQQRAGRLLPFPFSFTDADSGEGGTADRCLIQTAPTQSNGTQATVREWTLVTAEYIPNVPNA